ncbi:MAG: CBS domain-containing protein [Gammaproteobacteria bacterium]|jgi:CBS domain-containing protein|nr:CBS domain-containing protein [Gammaproteobacteria bacterium]MDH3559665.1 CBS domain-containing protein [Gammaproteobacteria bacterium]
MNNDMSDDVRTWTAAEVMHRGVLSADADWSIEALANFLTDNHISGAPVTDTGGELIGVVSLSDLVRHSSMPENDAATNNTHDVYLYALERHMGQEEIRLFHTGNESPVKVRDIMTPMVFRIDEDASVQQIADMLIRGGIHRVFVTEGSKLTGIVTTLDLLKVVAAL